MRKKITRLMCAGIACLCILPAMGQEKMTAIRIAEEKPFLREEVKLRADEKQQPDSVVMYDDLGEKVNVFYYPSFAGPRFFYHDYFKCWCRSIDHFYMSLLPEREYDVKYNSDGLVESISYSLNDQTNRLDKFEHNANGYLLSSETYYCPVGSTEWELTYKSIYIYDIHDNWVGLQSYTVDGEPHWEKYSAHTDNKGRIVSSIITNGRTTINDQVYELRYYVWYYSDGHTPNAEVENNDPVDNNQGDFDLNVNIPVDSVQSGSLVVQLPEGFTLDEANTSLTVDFAGLFDLTITKQENNSWLIEIKPKSLKSAALRADEIGKMLHIAYKVNDSVTKGTYNISINSIQFKTPGDNIIPEPAISVPVNVNRWGVSNELFEDSNTTVYLTNNTLYIQTSQTEMIAIYTINGSKVYEATIQSGTTTIDATAFPQGVLIVKGSNGWVKKVAAP